MQFTIKTSKCFQFEKFDDEQQKLAMIEGNVKRTISVSELVSAGTTVECIKIVSTIVSRWPTCSQAKILSLIQFNKFKRNFDK